MIVWGPGRLTGWAHKMPDKSPSWLCRERQVLMERTKFIYEGVARKGDGARGASPVNL